MNDHSFDALVEEFFGMGLPEHLAGIISLSDLPPDVNEFIVRALALMKRSGYSTTEFNPLLFRWLSTIIPNTLPRAWGGRIPPITMPHRHKKLDDYVAGKNWITANEASSFVDIGCGFPPVTTVDTARKFPSWQIYGVDRSFADYVLYDTNGNYACFDQKGTFLYFQTSMNLTGQTFDMDPASTRNRFDNYFKDLFPLLKHASRTGSETVEKDGNKLIHHHIKDFEAKNLTFIKSDILDLKIPAAKVIRCMNIFVYFTPDIRKKMVLQTGGLLDNEGILIAGTSGGTGTQSRYTVYLKGTKGLFPDEFAFSLDNLSHISFMPWFTIRENDPEATLLAALAGTIRSDKSFWPAFSNRLEELLRYLGICRRKAAGFLHFPQKKMSFAEYMKKTAILWNQLQDEGYSDGAVNVLRQAGYQAWKNSVGDIAVRPLSDFLL